MTFKCTKCDTKYSSGQALRTHMKTKKHTNGGIVPKKTTCELCNKKFTTHQSYKYHRFVSKAHKVAAANE